MKTNWQDPVTSEIFSSNISGLQEAVGKIEDSIGLKTTAETGITLSEVYVTSTDRYRIFQVAEGKRNWVASPAPVIKKNSAEITTGFAIDYGGGAIVLETPALSTDVFTADFTRTNSTHAITPASIGAESKTDADAHKAETAVLIPQEGSTANAILLNIVLTDKKKGTFRASANNTGNMTINGKAFKKDATTEIPANGVKANKVYDFYYDSTSDCVFILAKASGTAQPSDVLAGETFSNDDGEQVGTKDLSNLLPQNIKDGIIIDDIEGTYSGEVTISPSDNILYSESNEVGTYETDFTKVREIKTSLIKGPIRITFNLFQSSSSGNLTQGRIYVNGIAKGILRETDARQSAPATYTQDISIGLGDVIQLYLKRVGYGWSTNTSFQMSGTPVGLFQKVL